ncbi:MAG: cytochrome c family protein [Salinivirgaceae bacterium]|jgi:hypothetical protein|nr:cytochrome c family protein [Salinivirgaceae bacterium]
MVIKNLIVLMCFVFLLGNVSVAQDYEYIGAVKCKMCHNKTSTGKQYNIWANGPHANALTSLKSEKSKEYAKANGIADAAKEASCLKCHSTYYSASEDLMATITEKEGVSCESCHGPGSAYKSMSVMKSHEKSLEKGLILPTKDVCITCHNEKNPFHKPFDYDASVKKIAHPNPAVK